VLRPVKSVSENVTDDSFRKRRWGMLLRWLAALASAAMLWGAFPPSEQAEAAWIGLVPLILLACYTSPASAFRWGWLTGFVYWLASLFWLLRLGGTGTVWPLAALGWMGLAAYLALYIGAFSMTASFVLQLNDMGSRDPADGPEQEEGRPRAARLRGVGVVFCVPLLWVGFEYLRSVLFSGFPWNALGISQFRNLPVIQIAEWGGVYAVSGAVVLLNAAFAMMIRRFLARCRQPARRREIQVELMAGLTVVAICWSVGLHVLRREHRRADDFHEVRVACVQPNIKQTKKWDPSDADKILDRLEFLTASLTRSTNQLPDLIVWPETALPGLVMDSAGPSGRLARELAGRGAPLLVGGMEREVRGYEDLWYNSSILFDGQGTPVARYRKQHLVPFGEYLPLESFVPAIKRMAPLGFSCEPGREPTVFQLGSPPVQFGVLICFEDIMPYLSRRAVRAGAKLLINQTNDAWFDPSSASLQHMSHCVFRCVENRVPAVRSANTGVSAFISRTGRFQDLVSSGGRQRCFEGFREEGVMVPVGKPRWTFYTRYGDACFALPCGIFAAIALVLAIRQARRRRVT